MKISRQKQDLSLDKYKEWHKLVVAEAGFSMLDIYARQHDIDIQTISQFADQVNHHNDPGSLYPQAPISAFPRRYFRDLKDPKIFIEQFRNDLLQFIQVNQSKIHAGKVLVDFHEPVTEYIAVVEEVFRSNDKGIEQVIIFM